MFIHQQQLREKTTDTSCHVRGMDTWLTDPPGSADRLRHGAAVIAPCGGIEEALIPAASPRRRAHLQMLRSALKIKAVERAGCMLGREQSGMLSARLGQRSRCGDETPEPARIARSTLPA
ncbi:hypothetical protein AAFF_G00148700 [Aldrovandia affinis]|uniref:Uncharacterized protein n=1 Tax=Aldrovandia affinis TaxID=143900 RepID=A0AAD7RS17_9TELE|nr:hypothetical protein AAFF_G00148700 [Aldrovandia affinis]